MHKQLHYMALSTRSQFFYIGVGRFRKLGGQGLEYWGAKDGPNSQQAHDVVLTSMRRNDLASTSFRRHVPTRFLINQCQIITFCILKSGNIENSRIELKGIVLQVPSNQIKVTFIIIYPSTWYICGFFLFHIEIEEKCGMWVNYWGGGGTKGYVGPPSQIIGGGGLAPLFLRLYFIQE